MKLGKWKQQRWDAQAPVRGHRPHTLAARIDIRRAKPVHHLRLGPNEIEVRHGRESIWIILRIQGRPGGVAVRGLYSPDGELTVGTLEVDETGFSLHASASSMGEFKARFDIINADTGLVRWRATVMPATDLLMPPQPWNIHPVDAEDDPIPTRGIVHATQRGSAVGVLYFTLSEPQVGTFFYFQNLTALNDYCTWTHTSANTIVKENWPGLGFLPPPSEEHSLPGGVEVELTDAYFCLDPLLPTDERQSARLFIERVAQVYRQLEKPPTSLHDWPGMAVSTRRDLTHSSKVSTEENGYLYLRPYTSAEYPDSMVQLAVLLPLLEYLGWLGEKDDALASRLRSAVPNFFDASLGTLRRYLSTVGEDKDRDAVDSWYLYHPLANLGRLAEMGDEGARELFFRGVDFGIRVAHHFKYHFPVIFNLRTFEVKQGDRKPGELGQTDVPGLYAYVMHQAYELSNDPRYLEEANAALDALSGLGFTVGYQFNTVAWGIAACMRMFQTTEDPKHLAQVDVFLASFLHNTNIWACHFGPAEYYSTFMGVTCLHDGAYMAAYEEFEAYAAFYECLQRGGTYLSPAARLLMSEYCRYALYRGWFFYPGELPRHILSGEVRNGHIDRSLAIPLEDLYADWSPPGSVGQEVYGAGMAFAFVARAYRRLANAILYCDVPMGDVEAHGLDASVRLLGVPEVNGRLALIGLDGQSIELRVNGEPIAPTLTRDSHVEFSVPGACRITIAFRVKDQRSDHARGSQSEESGSVQTEVP